MLISMNIKQRFSLIFSLLFSVLLGSVLCAVFVLFSNFRRNEFQNRLIKRAETTVKLLVDVKGIDIKALELFDRNRTTRLNNEKTTVYDSKLRRLYTSNDNYTFNWTATDFEQIRKHRVVIKRKEDFDVIGMIYVDGGEHYYVLTSALDVYNNPYMNYLKYLLAGAFVFGATVVWSVSYYLSKKSLKPLDEVRGQIQEITDKNLNKRLSLSKGNDEVDALSRSFNQMMDRIDKAYQQQKEFTGNASHELRTPIARVAAQLENLIHSSSLPKDIKGNLVGISQDVYQVSDIVNSLLLLSEISHFDDLGELKEVRLDEVIFHAVAAVTKLDKDFKFNFSIECDADNDINLSVKGDEILLKIVFLNLIKNAWTYSYDKTVKCVLECNPDTIKISMINFGLVPDVEDLHVLFNTFVRGKNSKNKTGNGIGLSIAKRILTYHGASIQYVIPEKDLNKVVVTFPLHTTSSR